MKAVLNYLFLASLLFSLLVAFINRNMLKSRQLFLFLPYLFLLSIQEVVLFFYIEAHPKYSTGLIYNIYKPISTSFFAFFYYRILFITALRNLILWLTFIYLAVTIVTFISIQPISIYNSYLSLAGGFVATCCGVFFLFNYFSLDSLADEKHWRPVMWITIGIVAFFPVVNISFSFYKFLLTKSATVSGAKLYQMIPRVMSIFMYSCFAYAFYLCKKKN